MNLGSNKPKVEVPEIHGIECRFAACAAQIVIDENREDAQ